MGKDWVKLFLKYYSNLKTLKDAKIDFLQWKNSIAIIINERFIAFQDASDEYYFEQYNVCNIGRTGFLIETSQYSRVVIDTTLRTYYKMEPGR